MKRAIIFFLSFILIFCCIACGGNKQKSALSSETGSSIESILNSENLSLDDIGNKLPSNSDRDNNIEDTQHNNSDKLHSNPQKTNILIVYFSATGTTRPLAEYAADILNADIYEIVSKIPYTDTDLAYYTGGRADKEQNDPTARPVISGSVSNMEDYDTIILGYPIWHGQAPRIISTFLEAYDFSGKTILPFCTSHSSGIGSSDTNLYALAENAKWIDGRRFAAGTSREEISSWLAEMGIVS